MCLSIFYFHMVSNISKRFQARFFLFLSSSLLFVYFTSVSIPTPSVFWALFRPRGLGALRSSSLFPFLGAGLRCLLLIGSAGRSVGQARVATVVPGDWTGGNFWDTCAASNGCGLRGGSNPLVGGALKDTSCVCRAGRSESFCCFISWGTSMDDRNGLRGRAPRV